MRPKNAETLFLPIGRQRSLFQPVSLLVFLSHEYTLTVNGKIYIGKYWDQEASSRVQGKRGKHRHFSGHCGILKPDDGVFVFPLSAFLPNPPT